MSMGGGTSTTPVSKTSTNAPWTAVQPYINKGYQEATKLYSQGPQQYTPWSQVADLTQGQKAAMQGVQQYVNSPELQQALQSGQQTVSGLMTGASNPYNQLVPSAQGQVAGYLGNNSTYDPSQGINRLMYQNTQDPSLVAAINKGAGASSNIFEQLRSQLQNPSISTAIADKARQMNTASQTANILGNAYDLQNTQRMKAADLANQIAQNKYGISAGLLGNATDYASRATNLGVGNANMMANMPIAMLQSANQMGALQQAQNQAQLTDATNRWNFQQNQPYANLARYRNLISPDASWGTTSTTGTQTTTTPGSGQGIGQIAGTVLGGVGGFMVGGPMGAMMGSSLGGSLGGGIGGQFH